MPNDSSDGYYMVLFHFQRTERAPKDRNIAESDPQQFAQMLIERMQCVLEEREAGAKVDEKLRCLSEVGKSLVAILDLQCRYFPNSLTSFLL